MAEQIQNIFFSKDIISGLYKGLVQNLNLQNLERDAKQDVINILVKNMKSIYKSIDTDKINKQNFSSIMEQFKKHSIMLSSNELKSSGIFSQADIKFQRDFNSRPTDGNKYLDRPSSSKNNSPSGLNQRVQSVEQKRNEQMKMNDPFSGVSADMNNYDSSLDQAFKPIVDNIADQEYFNNYNTSRNDNDIASKMESIQKLRQNEIGARNQRPPTPDFLKSKPTNPTKMSDNRFDDRQDNRQNNRQDNRSDNRQDIPVTRNGNPDFKNMKSNEFNNTFTGLENDSGDNLYIIDNIDKPLVDMEIVEDTASFEDRLKRLQSDRDNVQIANQNEKIDFKSENFPRSDIGNNIISPKPQQNNQKQISQQSQQSQSNQQYQSNQPLQSNRTRHNSEVDKQNEMAEKMEYMRQMEANKKTEMMRQMEANKKAELIKQMEATKRAELIKQIELNKKLLEVNKSEPSDKFSSLKNSMKSMNIEVKEDSQKINQMKTLISNLEKENLDLKETIENLQATNAKLVESNEVDKIMELKKQIASEFESLKNKNEDIENKLTTLNLKEIEISKKESELKQMISNYDYLFKSSHLQMEVTNDEAKSRYTWSMNNVFNVTGIKLIAYSLPIPRFNIEENKNNVLILMVNDKEIKIFIPTAKYNIDDLIETLNNKINDVEPNIKLSLDNKQLINIRSSEPNDIIKIIPTILSKDNLGFINNNEVSNFHVADRIWDLRIEDKVLLYLNNLSDEVPFGILYFNGQSISQFKFQQPYNLDKLDIIFKDSKGLDYNFHGLTHSLSFVIEKI